MGGQASFCPGAYKFSWRPWVYGISLVGLGSVVPKRPKGSRNYNNYQYFDQLDAAQHNVFVSFGFSFCPVEQHLKCNGLRARLECGRSWCELRLGQTKNNKTGICCFSAKHVVLMRKSKVWVARNQDNVLDKSDMSICGLLFQ